MNIFDDSKNLFALHVVVNCSNERCVVREHLDLRETEIHCCDDSKAKSESFRDKWRGEEVLSA